ncbi:hypothetical protein NBCG_03558 [Nocardioidaceae bacterium Broad-1]|nr:hypothetical protein NBCG_03558 [Nocardioidaceae bacterium Broad-1]
MQALLGVFGARRGVFRRAKVGPPQGLIFRDPRDVAPFHLPAEPVAEDGR